MNWLILRPWSRFPGRWVFLWAPILAICGMSSPPIGGQSPSGHLDPPVASPDRRAGPATGVAGATVQDVPLPGLRQPDSLAHEAGCPTAADACCDRRCKLPDGCLWSPGKWLGHCWETGIRHIGKPWALPALFRHSTTHPRHMGKGGPLVGTSWLNRPYYVGWFLGPMFGDNPVSGMDQENDALGGFYVGWDFDHYWGTQLRLGWAALELTDTRVPGSRWNDDVFLTDLSVLYYPWGDTRWRPYLLLGLGAASFSFADQHGVGHDSTLLAMPFGGGVKYSFRRWMAMRAELLDNVAFASEGLSSMHNVSLILGVEAHWGGTPKSYWPWHPGRHVW